jgi:hypothetical protein
VTSDEAVIAAMRAEFEDAGSLVLQQVLDARVLSLVQTQVAQGAFSTKVHSDSGVEQCMAGNSGVDVLRYLLSAPAVLRFIEAVTGERPLAGCQVRVYRLTPGTDERHDWHDDLCDGRRVGLSLNLGAEPFEGGTLQLREYPSLRPLSSVRNTGPGDLAVFRLRADTQHQVLPVVGAHARTVLAGWFRE